MLKRYFSLVLFSIAAIFAAAGFANAASAQKTLLWKVGSPHRVLYLTGGTQMLMADDYPLPKAVMQAFERSGALAVEGNTDPGTREKKRVLSLIVKDGMLPSGKKLTDLLNGEQQARVKDAFSRVGFPFSRADSMRPWLAALVMMQATQRKLGVDPVKQETYFFIKRAKARNLPITPLESGAYQVKMFAGMAQSQQIAWLSMETRQLHVLSASRAKIVTAWRDGDTKTIAKLLEKNFRGQSKLYQALVIERNRRWQKTLVSLLSKSGKPVFVIVGAGHLAGRGNLVSALRKDGYKVTRL